MRPPAVVACSLLACGSSLRAAPVTFTADLQPTELTWMRQMPALRSVDLSGAWLTSGAMEGPAKAKRLESLTIRRCSAFSRALPRCDVQ